MQQRDPPKRANTHTHRRDRKFSNSINGKRGRCYLPEESEKKNPEAHPPARTSTRVVTGASKAELRLDNNAAATQSNAPELRRPRIFPAQLNPNLRRLLLRLADMRYILPPERGTHAQRSRSPPLSASLSRIRRHSRAALPNSRRV